MKFGAIGTLAGSLLGALVVVLLLQGKGSSSPQVVSGTTPIETEEVTRKTSSPTTPVPGKVVRDSKVVVDEGPLPEWVSQLGPSTREVTFKVLSSKKWPERFVLNSTRDYKHPECVTVVLDLKALPGLDLLSSVQVQGKVVRAKGVVNERGQVVVTRYSDVQIGDLPSPNP